MPNALVYSEFPKWLNPPSANTKATPVIVYDADQEAEYLAKGYEYPGTSDPHGYLVSKATEKMDDAIRTMNANVEKRLSDGLKDLYVKITNIVEKEINSYSRRLITGMDFGTEVLNKNIETAIASEQKKLTFDIMETIRDASKAN